MTEYSSSAWGGGIYQGIITVFFILYTDIDQEGKKNSRKMAGSYIPFLRIKILVFIGTVKTARQ